MRPGDFYVSHTWFDALVLLGGYEHHDQEQLYAEGVWLLRHDHSDCHVI